MNLNTQSIFIKDLIYTIRIPKVLIVLYIQSFTLNFINKLNFLYYYGK